MTEGQGICFNQLFQSMNDKPVDGLRWSDWYIRTLCDYLGADLGATLPALGPQASEVQSNNQTAFLPTIFNLLPSVLCRTEPDKVSQVR